jgi:TBC1 domain family member 5
MQDHSFFQEPSTQKILLDILFIYSKLHPDVGYRQGMHELLAPILWVVDCDAIESSTPTCSKAEDALMMDVLDRDFVAHDTFTLFCAVMQTAKSFYEIGDSGSLVVDRSRRIHDEYLGEVDPELANHLQVIEILPQIFLLRWIRLLFGREFNLKDTLSVWDVLFAENLSLSLVDMTCLAMLLRIRGQRMIDTAGLIRVCMQTDDCEQYYRQITQRRCTCSFITSHHYHRTVRQHWCKMLCSLSATDRSKVVQV